MPPQAGGGRSQTDFIGVGGCLLGTSNPRNPRSACGSGKPDGGSCKQGQPRALAGSQNCILPVHGLALARLLWVSGRGIPSGEPRVLLRTLDQAVCPQDWASSEHWRTSVSSGALFSVPFELVLLLLLDMTPSCSLLGFLALFSFPIFP